MELQAAGELRREIDRGVTAGEGGVPPACLAAIKGLVRAEPVHAPAVALETLLLHLRAAHAQERLGALAIADVLFQRSHAFRLGLVRHMDAVLACATGHSPDQPLPPPAKYARILRREFCEMLARWHTAFGSKHKSLALAFGFVQSKLQQDVEWQRANGGAGSRGADDVGRVMQFRRQERLAKARQTLALFQERCALIEGRLAHARRELRCLVSFPGDEAGEDGDAGSAGDDLPAGGAGGAAPGRGAAQGASGGRNSSVFGSILAAGSSECAPLAPPGASPSASSGESGQEDSEEEYEDGEDEGKAEQPGYMCADSACASAQRGGGGDAPRMEQVVEMLGLAGRAYTLDVSVASEGLRGRVREKQRVNGAGECAVSRLADTWRELHHGDVPQLRLWRGSVQARATCAFLSIYV